MLDCVANSTSTPQGTVLAPFPFSLDTSDCRHSTDTCHLQKYADGQRSAVCVGMLGGRFKEGDARRLNKLIRKADSVLGATLDSVERVANRRMWTKLLAAVDNPSHPLHDTDRAEKLLQQHTVTTTLY